MILDVIQKCIVLNAGSIFDFRRILQMSCTLYWQVKPKSAYRALPRELRAKLEKKFNFPVVVSYDLIPYLEGLESCNIDGARELIDLILKYEEIELNVEC